MGEPLGQERFAGAYRSTYHSLTVEPIADDRDGKKRNAYYWTGSRWQAGASLPPTRS